MSVSRRNFIKTTALTGAALGIKHSIGSHIVADIFINPLQNNINNKPFIPNRVASWWTILEDIQWPQKKIVDKIKRRAAGFAEAKIDTAINFGFHARFDFSNYFGQLHGYYANVSEELKQYGIRFMDHYSCNNVERPANKEELLKLNRNHRHHVLLYHDEKAAAHAQYEGHYFKDIYQVDIRDGKPGYSPNYQFQTFCFNNPGFIDMHQKYLQRLVHEVPMDGIQVDDMCDYGGLYVCGCKYCRERFKKEYGHTLPPVTDKNFWGNITNIFTGGNYNSPAFRDWLDMRANSIIDHLKMVKGVIKEMPLMTCCSSTGPITLNGLTLNLEKMAPQLDFFMLENVGVGVSSINWTRMDAEAMHQKDIAAKRNNAPAMAISYTVYDAGGYLGWALSRFWGVSNWSSTLNGRLIEEPEDAKETHEIVKKYNLWEDNVSPLYYRDGKDIVEARIIVNTSCRYNGWKDEQGREHWFRATSWCPLFLKNNIGYRFVRDEEFEELKTATADKTPLILDGVGCVSDKQFETLQKLLLQGTSVWLSLPFGTHNEHGVTRTRPLSDILKNKHYKTLSYFDTDLKEAFLTNTIKFNPIIKQIKGGNNWSVRARVYNGKQVFHLMNMELSATPHPELKDISGSPVLKKIHSKSNAGKFIYKINLEHLPQKLSLYSPELGNEARPVKTYKEGRYTILEADLSGITLYAVIQ